MSKFITKAGVGAPLGAYIDDQGVNFCLYSRHASAVYLCLYDASGHSEIARIALHKGEPGYWHVHVAGAAKGQLYGYRVDGPFAPEQGQLFNINKLLLDPYAHSLFGDFQHSIRHRAIDEQGKLCPFDNAHLMPKAQVTALSQYKGERPEIAWHDTVIYECHVKGWSQRHPDIENAERGCFAALATPQFIEHIKALGVTSVELMPVQRFISEAFLQPLGLSNYWGYNTLNFFTPHSDYLVSGDVHEFQAMVEQLHQHNIEVLIDVVYNHSCEGEALGPCCHLRGIDNRSYYRLDEQGHYINDTGCGNTLDLTQQGALRLVMDSLRHWYQVYGVDGFRFDLASILGREHHGFNPEHVFFQCLAQDPVLQHAKLIAEPWDIGPGGYQLGAFPAPWRQWNDQYRDVVRRFWRGDSDLLGVLAKRLHGSADIFSATGMVPSYSINFITSHDGYTLADLVSYEQKHNHANGEHNQDGHDANYSCNYGVEGHSDDAHIKLLRLRAQKNLLLTLLLSKGVPMLSAGSEMGHSQGGNNNAYCQDNAINWLSWHDVSRHHPLALFISDVQRLRREFAIFTHPEYIHDNDSRFVIAWYRPDGRPMSNDDWHDPSLHTLVYYSIDTQAHHYLCVVLHRGGREQALRLVSPDNTPLQWHLRLSTYEHSVPATQGIAVDQEITLTPCSGWVFSNVENKHNTRQTL
ncbi:glycogen debranching protein GlgX [Pseudoalteromonas ruthenica]|uniref:glycogen debranching protein GlgX n=1 Tax=Pseudoalteromonas ruthenica TaxID=151081 RepID=UPI00241E8B87|nr:glycogen debranching protein GlgX [Pseudoalteromonas ruthenica]|tara:strand:- start:52787 stop:54862 length:2076 start_codon:yes stop_codon:yes gene_type:complete